MFDSSQLAIVRTRLPYTDRGALSVAWLSALGLEHARSAMPGVRRIASALPAIASRTSAMPKESAAVSTATPATTRPGSLPSRSAHALREPEKAASPRADRRLANASVDAPVRRAASPAFRSWVTLPGAGGERIHLVVRRTESAVDVVALCRPRVAELVRRALAGAALSQPLTGALIQDTSA